MYKNYIPSPKTLFIDLSKIIFNWLVVWKMTWGIWHIFTRALESLNTGTLKDPLIQSRKSMSLKFTEELCVRKWRTMQTFEEELILAVSKLTWGIWQILTRALKNLKNLLFNWLFWPKYIMFELRKVQRRYVWWHWRLMQNLEGKWLVLSKMTWGIWQIYIGWNKWIANLTRLLTYV